MIFYEIELLSVPEIIFACSVRFEKYKNQFINKKDFLEISLCEQGRMLFEHFNGTQDIVYPGMLIPILSDISCNTSSYRGEKQQHTTVGVCIKYNLQRYGCEKECDVFQLKERMKSKRIILIPYCCYMEDKCCEILNIFKKIIALTFSEIPCDRIKAIAQWYLLTGMLTDFVYNKLKDVHSQIPPSELIYADKATEYISNHYTNKLSVKDISEYIGISEGYLHRIFRDVKGMGVLEYVNRHRVSTAINLINNKNISLKEAAHSVGIEDPAYMSRMFKKITGLSYREYFKNKRIRL